MALTLTLVVACDKDAQNAEEQFNKDIKLIEDYLSLNNLQAQKTSHGVYYIIENPGNDEKPSIISIVKCDYKGYLLNGEVFDENEDIEFPLSSVIEGWQIGFPKFGKGGKGTLLIPSRYAYGNRRAILGQNNAVLIFDITLRDFR
jgi:FKBP-type peptidyl-prolyl cis-trans isomerase